jgi:hypothetical protein
MKSSFLSKRYKLLRIITLAMMLGVAPVQAGWWSQVKTAGSQTWDKTKELALQSLKTGKQAGHKGRESMLYGAKYSRQLASKTVKTGKTGWHHLKVIVKP